VSASVVFEPLAECHRPLLLSWLVQPHWRQWWGEPDEELRLIYAVEDGEHEPYLAHVDARPVAYVQAWWPSQHPDLPWQHGLSRDTRGIDISIGDAADLGKGYGTLIIRHFAAKLFAEGAPRLVIDPDLTNERAIACYLKAGFTPYDEADGSLLMELLPQDLDYGAGYAQD
jgi:aminoglycoside 6'-N-acetyltransferase